MMMSRVHEHLRKRDDVKLVIIDEAHHAAIKNVQYGPIFDYPRLGILGLTATPSRHDGAPLDFEKESFSIGFPDLVEKQVILSPVVKKIEIDGTFEEISDSGYGFSGLEALDFKERNDQIIQHVLDNADIYSKIIVFACNAGHAVNLHKAMESSELTKKYQSIDYITGESRSGNEPERKTFIQRIKDYNRSIVVNYGVLSEGYDDPKVNTVMMARPSRSKLVYMQAIGRAIRVDPANAVKTAYIVEVTEELPNIRYRIDNRWLFSEISDALEPNVEDEFFSTAEEFEQRLKEKYDQYDVKEQDREFPKWDKSNRYSLILFRYLAPNGTGGSAYKHHPVLINNKNRLAFSGWFNYLSERMESNVRRRMNRDQVMRQVNHTEIAVLSDDTKRRLIYDTMEEASKVVTDKINVEQRSITYVAFRFRQSLLSEEQQAFIKDMVNREQIEIQLKERNYEIGSQLMRFPLPLFGHIGQIITKTEFKKLEPIIMGLKDIKSEKGESDHRNDVRSFLDRSILPINMIYRESLSTIVREELPYYLELE